MRTGRANAVAAGDRRGNAAVKPTRRERALATGQHKRAREGDGDDQFQSLLNDYKRRYVAADRGSASRWFE